MTKKTLQAACVAVLVALATSGLFLNVKLAAADEFHAKPGETVEVNDGDTVVVDMPKSKTKVRLSGQRHEDVVAPTPAPAPQMADDDFSTAAAVSESDDPTSCVELSVRAVLTPSSPALGGTVGFSYKPANRVRLYMGANVSKGLLDIAGSEKELVAFGFTAGASKLLARTVEVGVFGTASWSYRDITHQISTSFLGAGPGFRVNKWGGFFQTSIMFGWDKKFASGDWAMGSTLEAA